MNLSKIMEEHDLKLSYLTGDLDYRIVPIYSGIAAFFRGIRFVDETFFRQEHLKPVLQVGPWGFCPDELTFLVCDKFLTKIEKHKNKKKKLTIDEALERLRYMKAVEDLVKACQGLELFDITTGKKFTFPNNAVFD